MKKLILYALLLLVIPVSSYAQKAMTPVEFNDRLADITDSMYAMGQSWGTLFSEVRDERKFSELKPVRIRLEQFLDKEIEHLKAMKDVGSSKELRMGMISFLQFERSMAKTAFMPIEKLNSNSTEKQVDDAIEHLTTEAKKEEAELAKYALLQEAYAKTSGFKLAPPKEEAK